MHFFSRNKALIAASLAATGVLAACGDDVTVPPPIAPAVQVTITPQARTMNIGEVVNFAVQITGGNPTPTLASCSSDNAAVATATVQGAACRVTAVAAGNVNITAAASSGQSAAAAVTVNPAPAAISGLTASPTSANLTVGQSLTIVPNVTRANSANTVTYAYASSNTAIATVNATTGAVTAVAPGTATITVTATGSGTGYANTTLTQGVTINVTAAPAGITGLTVQPSNVTLALGSTAALQASVQQPSGAAAATVSYSSNNTAVATVSATGVITGVTPGNAVVTVTATAPANTQFGASTLTQLVNVTVTPSAQVIINSLTDNGMVIDITNVAGQFEVNLQVNPNGQNVTSVQAFVCEQGEAQAACIARGPAAQQSFGSAGATGGPIQLYINSAEFGVPNFATGADANTLYKNGLKTIIATVSTTTQSQAAASNALSAVNFNNQDGWTIQWTQPTNRANDANGITWYGGPHTPDPLVPSSTSGTGSFVMVPVIYTPNRTIASAMFSFVSDNGLFVCGAPIQMTTRPFRATYGTQARNTTAGSVNFFCGTNRPSGVAGAVSGTNGYAPVVMSSIDNNNAAGPANPGLVPVAATNIYTPISAAALGNPTFANFYRASLAYRPATIFIPGDYQAPFVVSYDVRGGGGAGVFVDSGWVNGAYSLAGGFAGNGNPLRLNVTDAGVGLLGSGATTSARNTQFNACPIPATVPTTSQYNCSAPIASGGITATIASIGLPEAAANFTNTAYVIQVIETDRLGNRGQSTPFGWAGGGQAEAVTPSVSGANTTRPASFGVDLTAPELVAIPNSGAGSNPNFARTDRDSIYASAASGLTAVGETTADNVVFGVRFTDTRSGFPTCVNGTNCPAAAAVGDVRGGNFQIVRRSAPALVTLANDAVVENLVTAANAATLVRNNSINAAAGTFSGDPAIREFYVAIFGDNTRNTAGTPTPNVNVNTAAYYTFSGTLTDRAGNNLTIPARSVAIDNAAPAISSVIVPPVLTGGTNVSFQVSGSDDLEAIAGELSIRYPQVGEILYRRVPHFSQTAVLGLWHNPFAAVTDNKLATPIGPGTALGSTGLTVPHPFIQQMSVVGGGGVPAAPPIAANAKPDQVTAWIQDIRATSTRAFTDSGKSGAAVAVIAGAQVPSATTKNWTAAGAGAVGIQTWQAFNPAASNSSVEFRATTSTSITNPPFVRVMFLRQDAGGNWVYLGDAQQLVQLDQGGNRFWRWSGSFAGINQGQWLQPALGNGDVVRAVGVDAGGNALATLAVSVGAPAVFTNQTVVLAPAAPATLANGANVVINITPSANPNAANLTYSCSSNSAFITATMNAVTGDCTLQAAGTVTAPNTEPVVVTFQITGSAPGFSTTTITTTANITRIQ